MFRARPSQRAGAVVEIDGAAVEDGDDAVTLCGGNKLLSGKLSCRPTIIRRILLGP